MTVATTTSKAGPLSGDGSTTVFPFSIYTLAAADLQVVSSVASSGLNVDTTLTLGTHYTVALNSDQTSAPGGNVTMLTAPAVGTSITILRNITPNQGTSIPNMGGFYPKVLETALDRLTMMVQQLSEKLGRTLTLSPADTVQTPSQVLSSITTAGTTQVAAVNAAGTSQVSAVNTAGATQTANAAAQATAAASSATSAATSATSATSSASSASTSATSAASSATAAAASAASINPSLLVQKAGDTLTGALNNATTVTLASAGTVNIGAAASNEVTVSGTTTITAFDTVAAGARRFVTFSSALTLTYNAASMVLPGAASIAVAAGDTAEFVSLGGGNWRCTSFTRASGAALVSSGGSSAGANLYLANTYGAL